MKCGFNSLRTEEPRLRPWRWRPFVMRRDEIMRDALENPKYNIKFMGEPVPFDGAEPRGGPESAPTPALGADPVMEPNRQVR